MLVLPTNHQRNITVTAVTVASVWVAADGRPLVGVLDFWFRSSDWPVDQLGVIHDDHILLDAVNSWLSSLGITDPAEYCCRSQQGNAYFSVTVSGRALSAWRNTQGPWPTSVEQQRS